jgi:5-(carboxyamino)imidazole ribonucleotide synthase
VPVRPSPELVAVSQDRLAEKRLFRSLGIATAPFDDEVRPDAAAIVKTRRGGYDGRGQVRTHDAASRAAALAELPEPIVEGVVTFRRELSVIAARASDGTVVTYPLVANHHGGGILRRSLAPAPDVGPQMQDEAVSIARRVLERFGSVGVVAVELFDVGGRLVANEFAPRVHNSGHWTIEGAETSQFEQHVRAVLGLPLGSCAARGLSAMVNLIGTEPDAAAVLAVPGAHLHRYGKAPRPGRKLGHVTVTAESPEQLVDRLAKLDVALAT